MKRMIFWLGTMALCLFGAVGHAQSPFTCGTFGPNRMLSTTADLGLIATAMVASPGYNNLPGNFTQPGWFLIDSYGAGPLMGCQPAQSSLGNVPQRNAYFPDGMLKSLTASRFQAPSASLSFAYEPGLPYRLRTAENFCMAIGGQKVRYGFTYENRRLASMTQALDSDCPSPAAVTVTYAYDDRTVPGLPTQMTVQTVGSPDQVVNYAYQVTGGQLQSVKITSEGSPPLTIAVSYTAGLITGIDLAGTLFAVKYRNGVQWQAMVDPRFDWGLTISYTGNRVGKTLQNTGCPDCPPNTFTY